MTHQEIQHIHIKSADYARGFVYDEPQYQQLCLDPNAAILQATSGTSRGLFFPETSNKNFLAYDCLVKTVNFILGFPLFTLREQGIRLVMKQRHKDFEVAAIRKMKGGIPIECLKDFVVDDNLAYSFVKVGSFDYHKMSISKAPGFCPAQEVLKFIHELMLNQDPPHTRLLVILKGNRVVDFQHALCFIRKDYHGKPQLLMLDCKNSGPCYYPRVYSEQQLQFKPEDRVNAKKDLKDGVYEAADIYTLGMRPVAGEEKRKLENRMKWVLTGGEEHWKDSIAIGLETML